MRFFNSSTHSVGKGACPRCVSIKLEATPVRLSLFISAAQPTRAGPRHHINFDQSDALRAAPVCGARRFQGEKLAFWLMRSLFRFGITGNTATTFPFSPSASYEHALAASRLQTVGGRGVCLPSPLGTESIFSVSSRNGTNGNYLIVGTQIDKPPRQRVPGPSA